MHEFLTKGINFNVVPFQFPGRYVHGLTWQTFEAILQTISTRIQLYFFSYDATYNSRAMSTLANESFFADLVRYDKESHGYPRGQMFQEFLGVLCSLTISNTRVTRIISCPQLSRVNTKSNWPRRITFVMLLRHLAITTECTRIISLTFQIS